MCSLQSMLIDVIKESAGFFQGYNGLSGTP